MNSEVRQPAKNNSMKQITDLPKIIKRKTLKILRKNDTLCSHIDRLELKKRFKNEIDLIDRELKGSTQKTSVLHYSLNKAATQYVKDILVFAAEKNSLIPINLAGYAFRTQFPYLDRLAEDDNHYSYLFHPKGFLYSVLGGPIHCIEELEAYKKVLIVRDPRDMLVSSYFSKAISHPVPPKGSSTRELFLKERKEAQSLGVNEYVLKSSQSVLHDYQKYLNWATELNSAGDSLLQLKYEDMIGSFDSWLSKLLDHCDLPLKESNFNHLVEKHNAKQRTKEAPNRHLRKGKAGDHREKLSPQTIAQLDDLFSEVLKNWGYNS